MGIFDYALLVTYAFSLLAVTVYGARGKDGGVALVVLAVLVFVVLVLIRSPGVPIGTAAGGALIGSVGGAVLPALGFYFLGAWAENPRRVVFRWLVTLLPFSVYVLILIALVATQLQCSPGTECP